MPFISPVKLPYETWAAKASGTINVVFSYFSQHFLCSELIVSAQAIEVVACAWAKWKSLHWWVMGQQQPCRTRQAMLVGRVLLPLLFQELMTVKSDDLQGRSQLRDALEEGGPQHANLESVVLLRILPGQTVELPAGATSEGQLNLQAELVQHRQQSKSKLVSRHRPCK